MGKKSKGYLCKSKNAVCAFCKRNGSDETEYGLLYTINDINCHYFCILLSTKMVQNGKDTEGILGFLYSDIRRELDWAKKKKCFYCNKYGATIFCCHRSCRKLFHLPCSKENGALHLFYKTYQTFCREHRIQQIVPKSLIPRNKSMSVIANKIEYKSHYSEKDIDMILRQSERLLKECRTSNTDKSNVCYICYEELTYMDNVNDLLWPLCCKADTLFHRKCLTRMAISAGMHYIRCPLCNNRDDFINALNKFGIFIPDQDAAWERENNAFNDLLYRPDKCIASECIYSKRSRDLKRDLLICDICGSEAVHKECANLDRSVYVCPGCVKFIKDDTPVEDDSDVLIDVESFDDDHPMQILNISSDNSIYEEKMDGYSEDVKSDDVIINMSSSDEFSVVNSSTLDVKSDNEVDEVINCSKSMSVDSNDQDTTPNKNKVGLLKYYNIIDRKSSNSDSSCSSIFLNFPHSPIKIKNKRKKIIVKPNYTIIKYFS